MDIIFGSAPQLHHSVSRTEHPYRSVASRFLVGHCPLDHYGKKLGQDRQTDIEEKPQCYQLKPGEVEGWNPPNGETAVSAIKRALNALQVNAAPPHGFDTQVLVCKGAVFHDDLHGWDNSLFLNWYVAGPPRDFIIAGIGRVTLNPGDVILFDPSRPHSLVRKDMPKFSRAGWKNDSDEFSVFLSGDIALTPELDALFGISRGSNKSFEAKGSVDTQTLVLNKNTGALTPPVARRKAAPATAS